MQRRAIGKKIRHLVTVHPYTISDKVTVMLEWLLEISTTDLSNASCMPIILVN
jgi:hypothetical protein